MDVSFFFFFSVIDHEFHHNIVSSLWLHLAIALWIHSYFDNVMTKFMINNRIDA